MMDIYKHIKQLEEAEIINDSFLHITAYENQMSHTAKQFMDTSLSERYYFGGGDEGRVINWDPFTTLGQPQVEAIIEDAERAMKSLMGASVVNLRCLSGVHAMMCAIFVATEPGDAVMIVEHDDGGHFSTPVILERSGREVVHAVFDAQAMRFDITKTAELFKQKKCKALYLDISYPLSPVNLSEIRQAIGEEAIIIYDASHTIGLMMGGQFQNPFNEGADIICANTHKTLPGPHKGLIMFKDASYGGPLNDVINNGLFSTSHIHHLIALSITILEMEKYGVPYTQQIVRNSNALGAALVSLGRDVRKTGDVYSQTHQVHLYLPENVVAADVYKQFIDNKISTNFDDRLGGRLFARLGTQELTRRGMKEDDMYSIAEILNDSLNGEDVRDRVDEINSRFSKIEFSFDEKF